MKEIHCVISGRVQMVMFRDFVKRAAVKLELTGFVFNDIDGTVVAVAQGEKEALNWFIERLKKGSMLSRVDDVAVTWREPKKTFDTFNIVY